MSLRDKGGGYSGDVRRQTLLPRSAYAMDAYRSYSYVQLATVLSDVSTAVLLIL